MPKKTKKKPLKDFLVYGDYWGFEVRIRAHTEGEAKDKFRKRKNKPHQICHLYAEEALA